MQMIELYVFYLSKQVKDDFWLSPSSKQNFPAATRGCSPQYKLTVHQ